MGGFHGSLRPHQKNGLLHEVAHVVEQVEVRLVVALLHHAAVVEHAREDGVLVDGAVLGKRAGG